MQTLRMLRARLILALALIAVPGWAAAVDLASIYRPITPCTLIDTRGVLTAAITVSGPIAANTRVDIDAHSKCGLPVGGATAGIVGLSLQYEVQNTTPASLGWIGFGQYGTTATLANVILDNDITWTSGVATATILDGSGKLSLYVDSVPAHVVLNVTGYYQDTTMFEVGTAGVTVFNTTGSGVLTAQSLSGHGLVGVSSSASGVIGISSSGIGVLAQSTTGSALRIGSGSLSVNGAGIGTSTAASIHQVNTSAAYGSGGTLCSAIVNGYSIFDNPQANNDPDAMILLTPRTSDTDVNHPNKTYVASYHGGPGNACTSPAALGKWTIGTADGTPLTNGILFNVLVIKK